MDIAWMTPPKVGDTVRVEELSSYKNPPYTPFYAEVLTIDNTAMITVERRGEIWEAYAFEYLTKEQEVANKEYLETTFPDGTPVKIYPVKEDPHEVTHENQVGIVTEKKTGYLEVEADAIETMIALADKSPVIEHGAVNAVYYKDLIVLSGKWKDEELTQLRLDYPQIKHIITIHNKSFDRWNKS